MKRPKYFAATMQDAHNIGVNPFALTLLAESFADVPSRFGDENLIFLSHAHNGQEVWFVMSRTRPIDADFDGLPLLGEVVEALKALLDEPWIFDPARPKHWVQEQARGAIAKAGAVIDSAAVCAKSPTGKHNLAGGGCDLCGAVYNYPGWFLPGE